MSNGMNKIGKEANLAEVIKRMATDGEPKIFSFVGSVVEVDVDERTCVVDPVDTGEDGRFYGVRIQGSIGAGAGVFMSPTIGSYVVVTMLNEATGFVSIMSEVDEILIDCDSVVFNGGNNGGLINISDLTTEIQKLNANFNALANAFNTWVPVPTDGGAALKAIITPVVSSFQSADLSNVTDDNITH
jgi:hypothetical protein